MTIWHRWRERAAETQGPFLELMRHFYLRLLDTDLVSEPGRMQPLVIGVVSAIAGLMLYFPLTGFRKYVDLTTRGDGDLYYGYAMADRLFYILFAMLVTGLVTALLWQQLFPADRDYTILMPLPITRLQMFAAKFLSLFLFVNLFAAAAIVFPSVTVPMIQDSRLAVTHFAPQAVGAHLVASFGAAWFMFLSQVTVQGLLMNLLGDRLYPRLSLAVQVTVLLALLIAAPQLLEVISRYRLGWIPWDVQALSPPFWYHAMLEMQVGRPTPHLQELARRGWLALGLSALGAVLLYSVTYFRQTTAFAENRSKLHVHGLETLGSWCWGRLNGSSSRFAVVSFIFKTLARSRQHKLLLSAYLGLGLAVLVNLYVVSVNVAQVEQVHSVLSAPLVICFVLLSGLRVVFSIPVALQANWLFRMLEADQGTEWLAAIETVFYVLALAPVLVLAPLFTAPVLGWSAVPGHLVVCALSAMILAELMLREWRKVPFVCSYLPGTQNIALTLVLYWMGFTFFAFTISGFEVWAMSHFWRMLLLIGLLIAAFAQVRLYRLEGFGLVRLVYEDLPEAAVETLGLQER